MYTIETVVTIAASPEKVWDIIVDFDSYPQWNPLILWAEGDPVAGKAIKVHIRPPGENGMTHQPTVLIATAGRHLQWLGKVAVPGLFAGRHEFILESVAEGTRLVQREKFTGVLVPFLRRTLRRTEAVSTNSTRH
ncbi:MAG: SRPBCC family protein [Pseudonocardiaceae bacterium]